VEAQCREKNIPFILLSDIYLIIVILFSHAKIVGDPVENISAFAKSQNASCLVADFRLWPLPL